MPSASAFEAERGLPAFHKIRVKVRRQGLTVRSRSGFYGILDDRRTAPQPQAATLGNAVLSPFQSSGIHLRLDSLFVRDRTQGPLLQSLLRIDAGDLNLEQGTDASLSSRFEILAATFDADDRVVDQQNRIGRLQLTPNGRGEALRREIRCLISVPVKKPGAYQLRVAVRDTSSRRMGSAYEFVQVPDLGSGRLSLSGVFMVDGLPAGTSAARESASEGDGGSVTGLLRTFSPGRPILYGLTIYNARVGQGGKVRLTTRIRLFHAGRLVLEGNPRPVDLQGQPDVNALLAGGTLVLPNQIEEGDYELQVIVEDKLGKQQSAVQTADFELTRGEPQPTN